MKKVLIVALILVSSIFGSEWRAISKVDDFTDQKVQFAVYEDDKHRIQLSREGDIVWMYVSIKTLDQFHPNGLIELRVDKNEVRKMSFKTLNDSNKYIKVFEWKPSIIAFRLTALSKISNVYSCGSIEELINGKELKIRYMTALDMGQNSFSVPLINAGKAIKQGLDINECIDSKKLVFTEGIHSTKECQEQGGVWMFNKERGGQGCHKQLLN